MTGVPAASDRDCGAADALGLVLLAPAAIGLAVLVIALGRGVDTRAQVRSAAAAGAQAAALERSQTEATSAANRIVDAMLVDEDACPGGADVSVSYPGGPAGGTVTVTVQCGGSSRGLELVQPDARSEAFSATATIDVYKARRDP